MPTGQNIRTRWKIHTMWYSDIHSKHIDIYISNIGTGGIERLCCAFHTAHPRARIHVAGIGSPFESQRFLFVSPPAHTKIFRILGEKQLLELRFKVNVSTSGAPFRGQLGITSHIVFLLGGKFEVNGVCVDKIASSNVHHALTKSHLWTSHL